VLTKPGLGNVVPAIETSRRVFQHTLNIPSKKIGLMLLLVAGFLLTGHKPLTPLLMVLIIFLNDFLTIALATDRMSISSQPNPWRTGPSSSPLSCWVCCDWSSPSACLPSATTRCGSTHRRPTTIPAPGNDTSIRWPTAS
jgi:hypothetical protein